MFQEQNYSLFPTYEDHLCRRIGVLQQLQTLLSTNATLNDVAQLIQNLEQDFGNQAQLEGVIQHLMCCSPS